MVQKMSTILLDYFEIKYNLGAEIGCFLFMKSIKEHGTIYTPEKMYSHPSFILYNNNTGEKLVKYRDGIHYLNLLHI